MSLAWSGPPAMWRISVRHDESLRAASRFMALPDQRDMTFAGTRILPVGVGSVQVAGRLRWPANRLQREAPRDAQRFGALMAFAQSRSTIDIAEQLR